jgi:hypothetical protein
MYLQSYIYKNITVSFDFITTWNQGVFLCSLCTILKFFYKFTYTDEGIKQEDARCDISGLHSSVAEVSILLGFDIIPLNNWYLMFWDSMAVVGSKILSLEDKTTTLSQNVGNQLPSDTASYPKRTCTYNDEFFREHIYQQEYCKGNKICGHTI